MQRDKTLEAERDFATAQDHHRAGRLRDAKALYRRALAANPRHARAMQFLGCVAFADNEYDEAERLIRKSLVLDPADATAYYHLGEVFHARGRIEEAAQNYRQALALDPDYVKAYNNLGNALSALGRPDEAAMSFERAIALAPNYAVAHTNLGNALLALGQLEKAEKHHRRAIVLQPDSAIAYNNLGAYLNAAGRIEDAIAAFRCAIAISPGYFMAHSNHLGSLNYLPGVTPDTLFAEHRAFDHLVADSPQFRHSNTRDPDRRLKIGYVSPDFRRHPVGYFLAPVLANHDRRNFLAYCYYGHFLEDSLTGDLRRHAHVWRSTVGVDDEHLASMIHADGIDILVDLAGHTQGNRLPVFARKPAPIQATWAGYACTTGLSTIDYCISDNWQTPPGSDKFFVERLARLPDAWACVAPLDDAPEITPPSAVGPEAVTFGCFNNLIKINAEVIALWARLLGGLPRSKLLVKTHSLKSDSRKQDIRAQFAAHGIAHERIILEGPAPHRELLQRYGDVDIALDPFPYSGGLTTIEALWMGVPVVTLAGVTLASRLSLSFLNVAGLKELVAEDADAYLRIARDLARDLPRLASLRAGMRARLLASPLFQAERFTKNLESAYREMWRTWCGDAGSNAKYHGSR